MDSRSGESFGIMNLLAKTMALLAVLLGSGEDSFSGYLGSGHGVAQTVCLSTFSSVRLVPPLPNSRREDPVVSLSESGLDEEEIERLEEIHRISHRFTHASHDPDAFARSLRSSSLVSVSRFISVVSLRC